MDAVICCALDASVVGGAGDVGGRRVELGDERAEAGRHLAEGAGELAELVVGLEGELVAQLAARDAVRLVREARDAAREVRGAEEGQRDGEREGDGAVDHEVEHRGARLGDQPVGAAGDDERADDALIGEDRAPRR